ncbi:hypothetical protein [Aureimonas psammosilenae]|uniref:hypothetical protein n=1 Tax=Aureimonas psammosilenae TaxID=2495496 RepID=UPI0012607CC7|nr:hypothetical protein [Aureimonas psammosilenae]
MAVYIVTWNMHKERPNYLGARDAFLRLLGRYDNIADGGLETVRWISTTQTVDQVSAVLQQRLDGNDRLYVAVLSAGHHYGWLNHSVWEWLKTHQ